MQNKIETIKATISSLESQLKSSTIRGLFEYIDKDSIREALLEERLKLIRTYKSNSQLNEALDQLNIAFEFLSKNVTLNSHKNKVIDVLILRVECSEKNIKLQRTFLNDLLNQLLVNSNLTRKKEISIYLEQYVALVSPDEGIKQINGIIPMLNKTSPTDDNIYRHALNLKINLLHNLNKLDEIHNIFVELIKHYKDLNKIYLDKEQKLLNLNAYGFSYLNNFPIHDSVKKMAIDYIKERYFDYKDYEVRFESVIIKEDRELLERMAITYAHGNITPPIWFPKHNIKLLEIQKIFHDDYRSDEKSNKKKPDCINTINADTDIEIDITPEYEKIKEKITLDWDKLGVAGYRPQIRQIVNQLFVPRALSPEQQKQLALKLPRGGILYGPPGTGKTLMARAIASYIFEEANVTVVNGPELISKYVGESTRNLKAILEVARANPNATHVVIIDEVDALLGSRDHVDDVSNKVKADLSTTLLTYLDGVNIINNLMVIGLTNYFERLDKALIRPGRLGVHVQIDLPTYEDRLAILNLYLSDLQKKNVVDSNLNLDLLAKKSSGLSGASIKAFIDNTVENYALSQIVQFGENLLKIGDIKQIKPLHDQQFLYCLDEFFKANKQKKSEQEIFLSRSFCLYNQGLNQQWLALRDMANQFTYSSPMLINISGSSGTGTTSFALNLFEESQQSLVYMRAEELVNLSAKEQKNLIDNRFSKALLKGNGVLIIDDLEDLTSCIPNPLIYLRNKLKSPLSEDETLKIILIAKKEEAVNTIFKNQISCDALIKMPLMTQKEEVVALIKTLGLDIEPSFNNNIKMKAQITISALKKELLIYANKIKPEKIKIDKFIEDLNALYADKQQVMNIHRMFNNNPREDGSLTVEPRLPSVQY